MYIGYTSSFSKKYPVDFDDDLKIGDVRYFLPKTDFLLPDHLFLNRW